MESERLMTTTEEQVLRLNLESLSNPDLKPSQVSALIGIIEIILGANYMNVLTKVGYDLYKAKQSFDFRAKAAEKIKQLIGEQNDDH